MSTLRTYDKCCDFLILRMPLVLVGVHFIQSFALCHLGVMNHHEGKEWSTGTVQRVCVCVTGTVRYVYVFLSAIACWFGNRYSLFKPTMYYGLYR